MSNPKFGYIKLGCGHVVDQDAEDLPCQECAENEIPGADTTERAEQTRAAAEALAAIVRGIQWKLTAYGSHWEPTDAERQAIAAALTQWEGTVGK